MMSEQPCVRNCCLDQHDVCLGCGRTINEIIEWHQASASERQQILLRAKQRLEQQTEALLRRRAATPPE